MDPEKAHNLAGRAIAAAGSKPLGPIIRSLFCVSAHSPRKVFGREVPSVLGIAAGFDKNALMAKGLANLGFGFVEIGTVTAHPQPGNEAPRLFRIPERKALRNR